MALTAAGRLSTQARSCEADIDLRRARIELRDAPQFSVTINRRFKGRCSELYYGCFVFRRHALPSLIQSTDDVAGFEIETFISFRALKKQRKVAEFAGFGDDRIHRSTNLNAVRDWLRIL